MPSEDKLAKPSTSGVFNLCGLCHELGHMAMYRVLKDRGWMIRVELDRPKEATSRTAE